MTDYKSLYYFLFNGITDIINMMESAPNKKDNVKPIQYLKLLQMGAEELFMRQEDDEEEEE